MQHSVGEETYYPAFLGKNFGGFKLVPSGASKSPFTKVIGYSDSKNHFYKASGDFGRRGADFNYVSIQKSISPASHAAGLKVFNLIFVDIDYLTRCYLGENEHRFAGELWPKPFLPF